MTVIAFALRADYEGTTTFPPEREGGAPVEVPTFMGGVLNVGDRSLDLREELDKDPAGVILVESNDTIAVAVLDGVPALKRVTAPDDVESGALAYDRLNSADLDTELKRRRITGYSRLTVPQKRAALAAHDAALAEEGNELAGRTAAELLERDAAAPEPEPEPEPQPDPNTDAGDGDPNTDAGDGDPNTDAGGTPGEEA